MGVSKSLAYANSCLEAPGMLPIASGKRGAKECLGLLVGEALDSACRKKLGNAMQSMHGRKVAAAELQLVLGLISKLEIR